MCTHLAAANDYKIDHLKSPEIWRLVQQAKMYYVGGYHLTVCPEAAVALGKEAAENNKTYILSLSAPFIPTAFKAQVDETSPYWDYVIGNETEARCWASAHDDVKEKEDVKVIARQLAELPKANKEKKRVAVVTQGTEETVIAVQGESDVRTYKVRAIGTQEICDTNGAGLVTPFSFFTSRVFLAWDEARTPRSTNMAREGLGWGLKHNSNRRRRGGCLVERERRSTMTRLPST